MSAPGFLAVGGVEVANNARTATYLQRGLGGPWFQSVTANPCPDLVLEAWPSIASVCAAYTDDQLYTNPIAGYRIVGTGAAPVQPAQMRWFEAGYLGFANGASQVTSIGIPNLGTVNQRVRVELDVLATGVTSRGFGIFKAVNVGTGSVAYSGCLLDVSGGGVWSLKANFRGAGFGGLAGPITIPTPTTGKLWFEVNFTATGFTGNLYGADPDMAGVTPIVTLAYGWATDTSGTGVVFGAGVTEQSLFSTATDVVLGVANGTILDFTQVGISEVRMDVPCDPVNATLVPSDTLWPSDDLYPQLYGEFHDPGTDNAPWVDIDRPESYDFLGLIIDEIKGLDTSSDRSVDPAADGIGGILGPETLGPRVLDVTGWLIAASGSGMQYARRWFAETLADSLCAGCDTSYVNVRTTCSDDAAGDFNTNRWTCYDAGLTGMSTDVSGQDCDFVTPVQFSITCGDPFLYGPRVFVTSLQVNPTGGDATPVPFESWLFGQPSPVCITVADQGIGIDAPIFMFSGAVSGFEGGMAYASMGTYPSESLWPGDCVYPSDGSQQWSNDACPYAFTFSLGPSEAFEIDNSRRRLTRYLADGTTIDGSPSLKIAAGEVIQWLDTCSGVSQDVCASAFAGCTCDDSAVVTIYTQHRER